MLLIDNILLSVHILQIISLLICSLLFTQRTSNWGQEPRRPFHLELKVTLTIAIASAAHAITAMEVYMGRLVINLVAYERI